MCAMCICTQLPLARPPADPFAPQPVWSGRLTGNMVASRLPAAIMVRSKRSLDVAPAFFFSSLWWWNHYMSSGIVVWFWCLVLMFGSNIIFLSQSEPAHGSRAIGLGRGFFLRFLVCWWLDSESGMRSSSVSTCGVEDMRKNWALLPLKEIFLLCRTWRRTVHCYQI